MNLFKHEIKSYWKNLLFWSIGMLAMIGGGMIEFTGYYNAESHSMTEFIKRLPKAFLALFGMVNMEISSLAGYYGMLHLYLLIMGSIYAIILGAGILAKEERDKTSEFLMTKPVTRSWVLFYKLLAGVVYILAFAFVDYIISILFITRVAPKENVAFELFLLVFSMTMVMLAFFSIAFGCSAVMKDNRKSSNIMISFVSASYLASVYMDLVSKSEWMRPLVLFKYFLSNQIFADKTLDLVYIGCCVGWIIVGLTMAFIGYPRRDLRL
jgi:ABC-2 type transport system permease protein